MTDNVTRLAELIEMSKLDTSILVGSDIREAARLACEAERERLREIVDRQFKIARRRFNGARDSKVALLYQGRLDACDAIRAELDGGEREGT